MRQRRHSAQRPPPAAPPQPPLSQVCGRPHALLVVLEHVGLVQDVQADGAAAGRTAGRVREPAPAAGASLCGWRPAPAADIQTLAWQRRALPLVVPRRAPGARIPQGRACTACPVKPGHSAPPGLTAASWPPPLAGRPHPAAAPAWWTAAAAHGPPPAGRARRLVRWGV